MSLNVENAIKLKEALRNVPDKEDVEELEFAEASGYEDPESTIVSVSHVCDRLEAPHDRIPDAFDMSTWGTDYNDVEWVYYDEDGKTISREEWSEAYYATDGEVLVTCDWKHGPRCGTAACLSGFAASLAVQSNKQYENLCIWDAARTWLNIAEGPAYELFLPNCPLDADGRAYDSDIDLHDITKEHAVKVLSLLIENHGDGEKIEHDDIMTYWRVTLNTNIQGELNYDE